MSSTTPRIQWWRGFYSLHFVTRWTVYLMEITLHTNSEWNVHNQTKHFDFYSISLVEIKRQVLLTSYYLMTISLKHSNFDSKFEWDGSSWLQTFYPSHFVTWDRENLGDCKLRPIGYYKLMHLKTTFECMAWHIYIGLFTFVMNIRFNISWLFAIRHFFCHFLLCAACVHCDTWWSFVY